VELLAEDLRAYNAQRRNIAIIPITFVVERMVKVFAQSALKRVRNSIRRPARVTERFTAMNATLLGPASMFRPSACARPRNLVNLIADTDSVIPPRNIVARHMRTYPARRILMDVLHCPRLVPECPRRAPALETLAARPFQEHARLLASASP
jgi:hypothetical protein